MERVGFRIPEQSRKTVLFDLEEWYQKLLADRLNLPYEPVKRSDFGYYSMAVHYLTSVMEESLAVNKVAAYNIDHMSQIRVRGKDSARLLDRVLPIKIDETKIGQCKYTLLLTEQGTVLDDMIMMRLSEDEFILVINAGHDITDTVAEGDKEIQMISDADYILSFKKNNEDVSIEDISDKMVKVDIQGPYSYKVISELYGKDVLANRNNPQKNMSFFSFNDVKYEGHNYIFSRTGYTNRWGWEVYLPVEAAHEQFKRIIKKVISYGGLLVGLGGRDENRISAGNFGLPLYGHEYDRYHTPTNAPLFQAAIDMSKDNFPGKTVIEAELGQQVDKRLVLIITEGIASGRGVYINGLRSGTVTSSLNSPNIPLEKRLFLGSKRKSVNEENGTAAISLAWLYDNPFKVDDNGNDILVQNENPVRLKVELFREDDNKNPVGKPITGFISGDGVNPATAPKPLKKIENL